MYIVWPSDTICTRIISHLPMKKILISFLQDLATFTLSRGCVDPESMLKIFALPPLRIFLSYTRVR